MMEIKEIQKLRSEAEQEILVFVSGVIGGFQHDTGLRVAGVTIYHDSLRAIGLPEQSVITGCKISIEI